MKNRHIYIHKKIYNFYLNKFILSVIDKVPDEQLVNRIKRLTDFAYLHHTGYFIDGRIENLLINIGRNLKSNVDLNKLSEIGYSENLVCFVATELYDVGGHTRVLSEMISCEVSSNQLLILTEQNIEDVPFWFKEKHKNQLKIISLVDLVENSLCIIQKSSYLRKLVKHSSNIVLNIHPHDVIPIIALADNNLPSVIFENHAHSWFWLGKSISDTVISHTNFHIEITKKYRHIQQNSLLKMKFDIKNENYRVEDKILAKIRLCIPNDKICITTIGTYSKFFPLSEKYNIFTLINDICCQFSNAFMIIVGLRSDLPEINTYNIDLSKVRFVGYQSDLTDYYLATDICIDSMPEPSLGATVLSARIGLACPLFKYGSAPIFDAQNLFPNVFYKKYIGKTENRLNFLEKLNFLINNEGIRIKIAQSYKNDFIKECNDEVLKKNLSFIFKQNQKIQHKHQSIETLWFDDENTHELAMMNPVDIRRLIKQNLDLFGFKEIILLHLSLLKMNDMFHYVFCSMIKILQSKKIIFNCLKL